MNNIFTNDIENVVSISLLQLMQLFIIGFNSNHVLTNFNFDSLLVLKYINGITAHSICAIAVASPAHIIHILNQYMSTKSNIILVTQTIIATCNPKFGFSFTIKKLWNACCSIKKTNAINSILPYIIQLDSTSHEAFSILIIGPIKKYHATVNINQQMIINRTNMEKYFLANGKFFSQSVLEINALHPFPTINPKEAIMIKTGNVRFTAVKASFQTKLDTKTQSTTQ